MSVFWTAWFVTSLLLVAVSMFIGYRNWRVRDARLALLDRISAAARADIDRYDFDWRWRYAELDSVSYERMLFSLRPLDRPEAFYPRDPARAER